MEKGRVKWYNEVKGFGFIEYAEGKEIFVHRSGLNSPFAGLSADQEVMFEVKSSAKGPMAVNVQFAD